MSAPLPPARVPWRHRLVARYYRLPEHPSRLRFLRWLKRILAVREVLVEVAPGVVMELDDRDYIQRETLFQGSYEPLTLRLFERLAGSARGFIDVGAHRGQYALRAARSLAHRGGRVFAFEPSPANAAALLKNAGLSGLSNLDLFTLALSSEAGVMALDQPQHFNTGSNRLRRDGAVPADRPAVKVAACSFAELRGLLPDAAFDLVKVDVEGSEGRVLSSLLATRALPPPNLLVEYLPDAFDYGLDESLPAWLGRRGYRLRGVDGSDYRPGGRLPEDNLWAELAP